MSRLLHVFLCHASQDKPAVRELYKRLKAEVWIDPWLDEEKLSFGQHWTTAIEDALANADVVIIFLSKNSVQKEGFVQRELNYAWELSLEKPRNVIFLIPFRLDDCQIPRYLGSRQWGDYFGEKKESTFQVLVRSLEQRYLQKLNLEAEESAANEQAKNEAAELAEIDRLAREEKEKLERELANQRALEKATHEKFEREKAERAAVEKVRREEKERIEREAAKKAAMESRVREERFVDNLNKKASVTPPAKAKRVFPSVQRLLSIGAVFGCLIAAIVLFFLIATNLNQPKLSNIRMAKDQDGTQLSTTFNASETIYVVSDLSNGVKGNRISARWYAEDVPGYEANYFIDESKIDITDNTFDGNIYFYFTPPADGWPAGAYKVEVYFNGTLNTTVNFSVQ